MTRTTPAEVTATEFRSDVARILTDAKYGRPTTITNNGKPFAAIVHPDAANLPHPDDWQAARQAWESVVGSPRYVELPADVCRAVDALGDLLGCYFGKDQADAR